MIKWLTLYFTLAEGLVDNRECGWAPMNELADITPSSDLERIIGGQGAERGAFPWQACLRSASDSANCFCGGSVISNKWIITAAHCTIGMDYIHVDIGQHFMKQGKLNDVDSPHLQRFGSRTINQHAEYDDLNLQNDISAIEVDGTIEFNDYVQPVCFGSSDYYDHLYQEWDTELESETTCVVSGWGSTVNSYLFAKQPNRLQYTSFNFVNFDQCDTWLSNAMSEDSVLLPGMLCAGDLSGKRSSCFGDSGGPLVHQKRDGSWWLTGVVSWSASNILINSCASKNKPTVYADIPYYYDWIVANTGLDGFTGDMPDPPMTETETPSTETETPWTPTAGTPTIDNLSECLRSVDYKLGITDLYDRIVLTNGYCAGVTNNLLRKLECDFESNQKWNILTNEDDTFSLQYKDTNYCIFGPKNRGGQQKKTLTLKDCDSTQNNVQKKWQFNEGVFSDHRWADRVWITQRGKDKLYIAAEPADEWRFGAVIIYEEDEE